ncbi:hypothetical protein [Streptomyces sp. MP131-18]|uniref:hypothetical protein n=1 Tax=Streptomyces sp. MP131-18 TaxID=1857892 RepID=UPI0009D37029|nr:hypothetical protein [Streptomyces sp. MP131-18]ONK10534.1 hypothetical protein STBA_12560 [Streptomyces sp. MP131-18]
MVKDTDPYRLTGDVEGMRGASPGTGGTDVLRGLLWVVLVISMAGNMVASYAAAALPVHLAFGVVTALCVTALVVQRLRRRR